MMRVRRALVFLALLLCAPLAFGQSGTPAPVISHQFLTNTGAVCSGCLLNAYLTGTTTRQDTFTEVTLTTANANPIVLDSAGRATIFLSATSYRFVLTNSTGGTTYWTRDNVSAVPSTAVSLDVTGTAGEEISVGQVVYLSDGSGALTAGRWYLADADFTYASSFARAIAIAPAAVASGADGSFRLQGRVTGLSGLTAAGTYYVSTTAGATTATAPTNARFVGGADSTTSLIVAANPFMATALTQNLQIQAATPYTMTFPAAASYGLLLSTAAGVVTMNADMIPLACQGRLTLTTAVPVTTSDVTAAGTIYYTPYLGGARCALFDGTNWSVSTFTERSLALTVTSGNNYDVFLYSNAGTLTLELSAVWTNDTTRADAISLQNGVYVKTSATTRRYLGTIRASGSNTTEDSDLKRFVWNVENRVPRVLRVAEGTNTWTYTTATLRQANGAAGNQVEVVVGLVGTPIRLDLAANAKNTGAGVEFQSTIGLDSTTAGTTVLGGNAHAPAANVPVYVRATLRAAVPLGYHFYAWLEYSGAAGTTTWTGDDGTTRIVTGLLGWVEG